MPDKRNKQCTETAGKLSPARPARQPTAPDYHSIFHNAAHAVFVAAADGRFIDVNPAACRLTGYLRDELLAMRVGDLSIPTARLETLEHHRRTVTTGRANGLVGIRRKDGTQIPVEWHASEAGPGVFFSIAHDVSPRKEAGRALEESDETYALLVRLCRMAVITTRANGRVTSWNPAAERLFGYTADEALGLPVAKLVPPPWRKRFRAAFTDSARSGQGTSTGHVFEAVALRKDGVEVPIEVSVAGGTPDSAPVVVAVIRDISEHVKIVERLNDALQQLRFHAARMPLAYIVWDTEFHVKEWNPAAEQMFGYPAAEARGAHAFDLIVPPEAIPVVEVVWADLLRGDTSSQSINQNRRKDGSTLTCEWFNTPIRDPDGRIRQVCSMAMDVSKREETEAQLRNAQKWESLGVLAGGVAHDFNSSLMVILGNTALLRSLKGLPAKALEYLELIEEASFRARDFIDHLLAYARTGRHHPVSTDLNTVVQNVLTLVRSAIKRNHRIDRQLAKQLPMILADRGQVEQVILNLCLNADQAMPDEGTIEIRTGVTVLNAKRAARCIPLDTKPGRYVELVVSDEGVGMDHTTVSRVFEPFFTTKGSGHGLGLAAVHGILRQHHAAVLVDSVVGRGTKMHVFFPVHRTRGR